MSLRPCSTRIKTRPLRLVTVPRLSAAPSAQLVKVAGARWKVEDGFAVGKDLAALDEHQVRSWTILGLLTHAFLSGLAAASQPDCSHPCDHLLIALTRNEIQAVERSGQSAGRTRNAAELVPLATSVSRRM